MRIVLHLLLVGLLACGLAACGNKGKLKTPSQIEALEAKRARKQAEQIKEEMPPPVVRGMEEEKDPETELPWPLPVKEDAQ